VDDALNATRAAVEEGSYPGRHHQQQRTRTKPAHADDPQSHCAKVGNDDSVKRARDQKRIEKLEKEVRARIALEKGPI